MNFSGFSSHMIGRAAGRSALLCVILGATGAGLAAPVVVGDSKVAASSKTGIRVVRGQLELPRKGSWVLESRYEDLGGLTELYLDSPEQDEEADEGERMAKLMDLRETRGRRQSLSHFYWQCSRFARESDGVGPKEVGELMKFLEKQENRWPRDWKPDKGIHLVPGVQMFKMEGEKRTRIDSTELLLVDTTPAIDDGKHWTIDCRGVSKREEIDAGQMKKLGLEVKPQRPPHNERGENRKPTVPFQIYARITGEPGMVSLTARDDYSVVSRNSITTGSADYQPAETLGGGATMSGCGMKSTNPISGHYGIVT